MRISVIVTVLNESDAVSRLLDSLLAQSRRPDEIVICDGGSRDATPAMIEAYAERESVRGGPPIRLIRSPGSNISRGRNVAISAAAGPIIAATDAGTRLAPDWLEMITKPFEADPATRAVAGFFLPDAEGVFETAMAATVLPLEADIDPDRFLPSSRSVAFTKETWAAAGGYPEWLDYCEDLIFDFEVNALAPLQPTAFAWAPDARVYFKPRSSLASFWTQYFRYARGDGKADLWRKRHAARYVTYFVLLPALLGHAFFGFFARWLGWLGLLAGVLAYCGRPWQRLSMVGTSLSAWERLSAGALVPVIRVVGDVAKMVGYPVGLLWRWRNRKRPEVHWRTYDHRLDATCENAAPGGAQISDEGRA
ncbi:MAG: glycosyltransferase [Caldilineaceae bacterium]|nr:glycosyltransferase [Caldilineaceae bacterium]